MHAFISATLITASSSFASPTPKPAKKGRPFLCFVAGLLAWNLLGTPAAGAAELIASDGAADDFFGLAVSLSGNTALAGTYVNNHNGYVFRHLDTASGIITQNVRLAASDGVAEDRFGIAVSVSGNTALVGADFDDLSGPDQGSAYFFRNLDTASGTITQNVKLAAFVDGAASDRFGTSVSLSGNSGLVGAPMDESSHQNQGSAYLFRNLHTASGIASPNVKLLASDPADEAHLGRSVSLSGNTAVVGASGSNSRQGSAYLFRNLDTAGADKFQNAKLVASDGAPEDVFGYSVSLSGNTVVVGAFGDAIGSNSDQGSAYLYRNLGTASGTITQDLKLIASDGAAEDRFGIAVSLSGNTALLGAYLDNIASNTDQGSAYLFRNLDTASGTMTENVKLTASDGAAGDFFGIAVSIDGDQFVIGAQSGDGAVTNSGNAYTGSVSSVTTLDAGNSSRQIDGISFISRSDWIIGDTTDSNQVTLTSGDSAIVTEPSTAVYIGSNAGSDNNRLVIEGSLTANAIFVGISGAIGNTLLLGGIGDRINDSAAITVDAGLFDTAGLSETVGAVTLASTSIIDLGNGNSVLRFADSSSLSANWNGNLNIYNWSGDLAGGGTDQLYFGTNANGLAGSQLAQISFYSDDGTEFLGFGQILSTGEVVPRPPDGDGDGTPDAQDNCPTVPNPTQIDSDSDGIGDACDSTPTGDTDNDGIDNAVDNCPTIANPDQGDTDSDGAGNACDPTPNGDSDADGVDNAIDNCPTVANPAQIDTDGDGTGDVCDPTPNGDSDNDGIDNAVDNCPTVPNADQADTDGDGAGNACDPTPNGDTDSDGVDNAVDNCPLIANPSQTDTDADGLGDVCDVTPNGDTDNDGVDNAADNCPTVANPDQADADGDGIGDACDPSPTPTPTPTPPPTPTPTPSPTYSAEIRPPIDADGTSVFNANRGAIPVKFSLTQNGSSTCALPPATIALTRTSGNNIGAVNESVYIMSADVGSNFRIDGCQYIYNLSSKALGAGTYRVDILINSTPVGSATFKLK